MLRVLVTGANRGIGLAVATAYAAEGGRIFATCRQPGEASQLHTLARRYRDQIIPVALDVADPESIRHAVEVVRAETDALDLLYNNAGILPPTRDQSFAHITFDLMLEVLRVNTAAPLMVAQAFVGLLAKGSHPVIVNVSSGAGSIHSAGSGWYAYNTSKAALNMISKMLGSELLARGIITVAMSPGWVATDMGGASAPVSPEQSAAGMKQVVAGLTRADSGAFLSYDGRRLEW